MRIGIGAKLHTITAAALVGSVTVSGIGLASLKTQVEQDRMARTRNLVDTAYGVAAAMEEQNAAIREIVRGVSRAATGAQGVTENAGGLRQGADQTATASDAVLTAACGLARDSEALDRTNWAFLTQVTAA